MNPRFLASYLFSCLLYACAAPQTVSIRSPQPKWTAAEVVGLTIELIDPVACESMTFTRYGTVLVTAGLKNGPLTAPAYCWHVVSGRLRMTLDLEHKYFYDEIALISRNSTTITVRRSNGKLAKYKITRHERSG